MNAKYWVNKLELEPHPEGGYFKQTHISEYEIPNINGDVRSAITSIYFLLEMGDYSAFHRIASDEVWNYHFGDPIDVYEITKNKELIKYRLGSDIENGEVFQCTISSGSIFASCCEKGYGIVGCTVAPGFDYQDFKLFTYEDLIHDYSEYEELIAKLAYRPK